MNPNPSAASVSFGRLTLIAILLAIPAFWVNLGSVACIDDEGIRAQVALEMIYTGDYIAPRMFGEFYYKKPPLFNWLLAGAFTLTGNDTEWTTRSVTLVFLALYTFAIFHFFRIQWGNRIAWWTAFATLTCGRILFWDSMLGLIDITFSLVVFASFMLIYRYRENGHIRKLYLSSYLLTAVGFMLKALPAIAFQGLTLIAAWADRKRWKAFFHPWHFIAGFMCLGLLGIYYYFYSRTGDLTILFPVLLFESSQRTPVHFGIWDTLIHLLEFPLEMIYHFLPWSLLVLLALLKGNLQRVIADPFARYLSVIFLANIWLYWISPQVYPRYLLMLAPLYFGVGLFMYEKHETSGDLAYRIVRWTFIVLTALTLVGAAAGILFVQQIREVPFWLPKGLIVLLLMGVILFIQIRRKDMVIPGMVLTLLVFRLGFSLFVLPLREAEQYMSVTRDDAIRIASTYRDESLRLQRSTFLNASTGYYLTRTYGRVIPKDTTGRIDPGHLYIVDPEFYREKNYEVIDSMRIPHHRKTVLLVKTEK